MFPVPTARPIAVRMNSRWLPHLSLSTSLPCVRGVTMVVCKLKIGQRYHPWKYSGYSLSKRLTYASFYFSLMTFNTYRHTYCILTNQYKKRISIPVRLILSVQYRIGSNNNIRSLQNEFQWLIHYLIYIGTCERFKFLSRLL